MKIKWRGKFRQQKLDIEKQRTRPSLPLFSEESMVPYFTKINLKQA
jgi:hypothetical protein